MGGLALGLGALGSIFGGIGSIVSANKQAEAERAALAIQQQIANNQLDFEKQVYNQGQANEAPFLQAGQSAIGTLSKMFGNGGPTFNENFQAPTAVTEQNDPGYQFRLQQGQQALERSAAASGNLLSGGTGKALERYGQDYASNEYNNVYNRALNTYDTNRDTFNLNRTNQYNSLAGIAGTGQVANQQLTSAGQGVQNSTANTSSSEGYQTGNTLNALGTANASGYAGLTNAVSGGLNNLSSLIYLQQLLGNGAQSIPGSSSSIPGICWVAAELYGGWFEPRTCTVREWFYRHPVALAIYRTIGPWWAEVIKTHKYLRKLTRKLFDGILEAQWAHIQH